jgi:hypothetical protein
MFLLSGWYHIININLPKKHEKALFSRYCIFVVRILWYKYNATRNEIFFGYEIHFFLKKLLAYLAKSRDAA